MIKAAGFLNIGIKIGVMGRCHFTFQQDEVA
jgi:hypothetical protein